MPPEEPTCWTLIRDAREGQAEARDRFARQYLPVVRSYLRARWRSPSLHDRIDDAAQQVFLECFRRNGVLEQVKADGPGGFRGYLYGVTRNVARHAEAHWAKQRDVSLDGDDTAPVVADDETASRAFDRAWAQGVLREGVELLRERLIADEGDAGARRVEILRQHVHEDVSLRELARRFAVDRNVVQREFTKVRREFEVAVRDVLRGQVGDDPAAIAREWETLHALVP